MKEEVTLNQREQNKVIIKYRRSMVRILTISYVLITLTIAIKLIVRSYWG